MPVQATYVCGHPTRLLEGRRGKTRERIAERVASRRCPVCAAVAQSTQLTRVDGTKYTEAERADFVRRHTPLVY